MPLIYTLISRNGNVLVDHANPNHSGNFSEISKRILSKIPANSQNNKLTFVFEGHTFNFRLDRGIMFMCMCDESYGRSRPFQFIKEVQDTYFLMFTGEEEELSGSTLRSFKQVLASKMKVYSETTDNSNASSSNSLSSTATRDALFGSHSHSHNNSYDSSRSAYIPDKAHKVRAELDSVKGVIKDNLERVIARGESIESLVDRTESLNHNADAFRKASKKLKQNLCWANFKVKLLITLIVIVLLYCIAASYCGVTLSTCIG